RGFDGDYLAIRNIASKNAGRSVYQQSAATGSCVVVQRRVQKCRRAVNGPAVEVERPGSHAERGARRSQCSPALSEDLTAGEIQCDTGSRREILLIRCGAAEGCAGIDIDRAQVVHGRANLPEAAPGLSRI